MPLIEPGAKAPNFSLKDKDGKSHALKDYTGRPLVLYFYPKNESADCTLEACHFRDHYPEFSKIKAVVLAVSPDTAESHARFAAEHALPFTLLVDAPRKGSPPAAASAYGAWQDKTLYGRRYQGVVRTTYLLNGAGRVVRRWDKVKVEGHAPQVLAAVRDLHAGGREAVMESKPARMRPTKGRAVKAPKARSRRTAHTRDSDPPYAPSKPTRGKTRRPTR